jgi:hypothetical protein
VDVTGEVAEWVVPGMTCKVKVTTYAKEDALTVPAAAVRTDDEDKEKKYVLLHVEDADPERREVKVGKTHGGKTEILEGLAAGDKVLLGDTKPQEKKAAEAEDEAASEQAESEEKEAAEESDEEQSSDEPEQAEQDSSADSADPSE